jgi:quercetin dioxygenase-like cupin family protein
MACGTSLSWELDSGAGDKAACAKFYNSCGTNFPEHVHEQREWIIIIEGSMLLTVDGGEEKRLLVGMSDVIEPGTPHSAKFLEDCWYYAITVPREPNWPV